MKEFLSKIFNKKTISEQVPELQKEPETIPEPVDIPEPVGDFMDKEKTSEEEAKKMKGYELFKETLELIDNGDYEKVKENYKKILEMTKDHQIEQEDIFNTEYGQMVYNNAWKFLIEDLDDDQWIELQKEIK
ncbi:MAG: hypothetical protein ABIJ17_02015 [Patescibacteria group bacterium]